MRIVIDLDGTMCDKSHREHLLPNYDAFHAACVHDPPNMPMVEVYRCLRFTMAALTQNCIEIWSGRSEGLEGRIRSDTLDWLRTHVSLGFQESAPTSYFSLVTLTAVRMRPYKDSTPDVDLKYRWLQEARAVNKEPDLVFDDRNRLVEMWRREGIPCFQVAPGDF